MEFNILLIILSLMASKDYVNASTVKLSQNISRLLSENETEIECSYTVENILQIDSVSFLAFNDNSITFEQIVTYLPDMKSMITRRGQYLKGRVTLSDITQSSTKAVMVFNTLLCIDYTLYKCCVRYIDYGGVGRAVTSNNISLTRVSVQVPPSTPERITLMSLSRKSTPVITEGDNITYVCTGDVGTPPAKFFFQKFGHENVLLVNYTATKTSTHEFSVNCSFYRTSHITFKVTADDNQTVMRCAVVSTLAAENMYVESQPLEVNYAVKMPTIVKHPTKTDYLVGLDTRIDLTCTTDGNPEPSYLWYKDNQIENISNSETLTFTDVATKNSGIYTCVVSNTVNDVIYTKRVQIHVCIMKEGYKTPVINQSIIGNTAVIVISSVCGSIILILCAILFGVIQNKNKNRNDRSLDDVNTIQQQDLSLYESVDHALDEHYYEQLSTGEQQYTNTNLSSN